MRYSVLLIIILFLVNLRAILTQFSALDTIRCLDNERQALLKFKNGLLDDYGILSSWGDQENQRDCCRWSGIICDNITNHVIRLDLRADHDLSEDSRRYLRGNITPSLIELGDLSYLDLSFNNFSYNPFPEFIGSLGRLRYLNLSNVNFIGPILPNLGNLTELRFLDLSSSTHDNSISLTNLDWISSNLDSLEFLDLSYNNLSKAENWLQKLSTLNSVKELRLRGCDLPPIVDPSPSLTNVSSSLAILDLSENYHIFVNDSSLIFNWFLNFSNTLTSLGLSSTGLEGSILYAIGDMPILSHLDLSNNLIKYIPRFLGNMSSLIHLNIQGNSLSRQLSELMRNLSGPLEQKLEHLDLSWNNISGSLPNMSRFSFLTTLILEANQLNGTISEGFLHLPNLILLDLYHNRITGQVPDLSSCSLLRGLYLYDNMFNGTLPENLGSLSGLEILSLGLNQLEGDFTETHVANLSQLGYLDLSSNSNLTVKWNNAQSAPPFQLWGLTLAGCKLGPEFSKWIQTQTQLYFLDVSQTQFSDTIYNLLISLPPTLAYLNASNNQISGFFPNISLSLFNSTSVPLVRNWFLTQQFTLDLSKNNIFGSVHFLCNWTNLNVIDLSYNLFSNQLPDCFADFENLQYLNLANNHFHGKIPLSFGDLHSLSLLHLRNNNFSGQIPSSMRNCKELTVIDLGENDLTGEIPSWIGGDTFSRLTVLVLRSNRFNSSMSTNICTLNHMQVLDLSSNDITGEIPKCLNHLTAIVIGGQEERDSISYGVMTGRAVSTSRSYVIYNVFESAYVVWKREMVYIKATTWPTFIDLSRNKLNGEIPAEIVQLVGLLGLNISSNNLTGPIPPSIGQLELLNVLDLSRNHLSGNVPIALSELNHLGILDLSYNNLSGRIPQNGHMLTFDESSYIGNSGLCGRPLDKSCPRDINGFDNPGRDDEEEDEDEDEDGLISEGFYICMGPGFVVGFWGVIGAMLFNKSFRYSLLYGVNKRQGFRSR